jgi:C4-dicarboxylate-specific signal transduction histidine kinase
MKLSLRVVLLLGVIGIQVVTVGAISLSSYLTTQDALLDHVQRLMREMSRHIIVQSEQFLDPARGTASLTQRLAITTVLRTTDSSTLERYFFEQLKLYPWISGMYFGATDGSFIFVTHDLDPKATESSYLTKHIRFEGGERRVEFVKRSQGYEFISRRLDPTDTYDPRKRPWFIQASEKGKLTWTEPYLFFTSQRPGISVASPVYGADSGDLKGAVGVDIEIGQFSTFLAGLKLGEGGSALILNRNGDVIAHPEIEKIRLRSPGAGAGLRFTTIEELDEPIARAAFRTLGVPSNDISIDGPEVRTFDFDGRRFVAVFTPFFNSNWPWTMVVYVPEDEYLGVLTLNTRRNIYLAIAIGVIGCLLSIFIWRSIVRPMNQLSRDATAIQSGKFDVEPQTESVYREIHETAGAFRRMVDGLRTYDKENLRLRRLQAGLMEQIRKSSIGQFASSVSHELNNPLAAVSTNLQIASRLAPRSGQDGNEPLIDAIDSAREQSERAGAIIRGLRDLVEIGEPKRERADANQLVREAVDIALADENLSQTKVTMNFADGLPSVFVNQVQIQQVVLNLVRNAAEALSETEAPRIEIVTRAIERDMVQVSISDNGPGLPSDVQRRLFEPLTSTKTGGMGVGLSISRTIVESNGGRLRARSGDPTGTIFEFTMPTFEREELAHGK